jgi:hypothetical protein
MTANDILKTAKERLAELDAERAKLIAIIEAAEGKPTVAPAPNPLPFIPAMPQPMPYVPHRHPWEIDRRWDLGEVYCGTPTVTAVDGRFVDAPLSLEGVHLSSTPDGVWTIHNSTTPVDVSRGFVAGGVCIDTSQLIFRA